jgi:hypothetical protein
MGEEPFLTASQAGEGAERIGWRPRTPAAEPACRASGRQRLMTLFEFRELFAKTVDLSFF